MAQQTARDALRLRILVVRSGGIAGIHQQWQVEPHENAEEWSALVAACPWGASGTDPASRDRFAWRIEVWRLEVPTPRAVHAATVPDAQLLGPWRALVDRVQGLESHG